MQRNKPGGNEARGNEAEQTLKMTEGDQTIRGATYDVESQPECVDKTILRHLHVQSPWAHDLENKR